MLNRQAHFTIALVGVAAAGAELASRYGLVHTSE
jgi:hypothetical protein